MAVNHNVGVSAETSVSPCELSVDQADEVSVEKRDAPSWLRGHESPQGGLLVRVLVLYLEELHGDVELPIRDWSVRPVIGAVKKRLADLLFWKPRCRPVER